MEVLTTKYYKQFDYISRYSAFPVYYHTLDNKYIVARDRWISDQTTFSNYIVEKGDTYDKLALRYYNNPSYYWVICAFNRIQDPFEAPVVGTTLKIPPLSSIQYPTE